MLTENILSMSGGFIMPSFPSPNSLKQQASTTNFKLNNISLLLWSLLTYLKHKPDFVICWYRAAGDFIVSFSLKTFTNTVWLVQTVVLTRWKPEQALVVCYELALASRLPNEPDFFSFPFGRNVKLNFETVRSESVVK